MEIMEFQTPTKQQYREAQSETAKYRHLTHIYCRLPDGTPCCGVDIASQGATVVPWAIGFDLPPDEFSQYCGGHPAKGPIPIRGHADKLPFDDNSLGFVYSSHLLEDYPDWTPVLREWVRVLNPQGCLIVLVPDKALWAAAIARGQPPNCSHCHEAAVGELSGYAPDLGLEVVEDRLTNCYDGDYS